MVYACRMCNYLRSAVTVRDTYFGLANSVVSELFLPAKVEVGNLSCRMWNAGKYWPTCKTTLQTCIQKCRDNLDCNTCHTFKTSLAVWEGQLLRTNLESWFDLLAGVWSVCSGCKFGLKETSFRHCSRRRDMHICKLETQHYREHGVVVNRSRCLCDVHLQRLNSDDETDYLTPLANRVHCDSCFTTHTDVFWP